LPLLDQQLVALGFYLLGRGDLNGDPVETGQLALRIVVTAAFRSNPARPLAVGRDGAVLDIVNVALAQSRLNGPTGRLTVIRVSS
jgi:hypothetical protein